MYKEKFFTDELENAMEEIVFEQLDIIIKKKEESFCKCNICIQDIAAVALNNLPARYKNSLLDRIYISEDEKRRTLEMKVKVREELLNAIEKVRNFPHH
jgi:competence protein ComFB